MTTLSSSTLAVSNPWALVPSLGNLDAYISAVNRMPMLTLEQEQEFARKLKNENDLEAAGKLVLSLTYVWWCRFLANTWATVCPTATSSKKAISA